MSQAFPGLVRRAWLINHPEGQFVKHSGKIGKSPIRIKVCDYFASSTACARRQEKIEVPDATVILGMLVTRAISAGGVPGLVSVGGAIAKVSFLRQSFTEFKTEKASAFRELWWNEGAQDARLNSVERKHEGLEGEHNLLPREHRLHHGGANPHFEEVALTFRSAIVVGPRLIAIMRRLVVPTSYSLILSSGKEGSSRKSF